MAIIFFTKDIYAEMIYDDEHNYLLFVPDKITQEKLIGLIICLPGWKVDVETDLNLWKADAEKHGFIIADFNVDYDKINSSKEVSLLLNRIRQVTKELIREYSLGKKNIFLAGTSVGGMIAISLALKSPDSFNAVGVFGGARLIFLKENEKVKASRCRFYLAHGQRDNKINIKEFYETRWELKRYGAQVIEEVYLDAGHQLPPYAYTKAIELFRRQLIP